MDDNIERELLLYIEKMDKNAFPIQPEVVDANANRILARHHSDPETQPKQVGENGRLVFFSATQGSALVFSRPSILTAAECYSQSFFVSTASN